MKLVEFLNDDTCQILFAIIVGIVICYFIFGSCSSGSCNRDGFSVGGQSCVGTGGLPNPGCRAYPSETLCVAIPGCEWDSGPTLTTSCEDALTSDGTSYFTELTNQCQLDVGDDGARAVDRFDLQGYFDTRYEFSEECCGLVQNIPDACEPHGSFIDEITDAEGSTLRQDLRSIDDNICSRADRTAPGGGRPSPEISTECAQHNSILTGTYANPGPCNDQYGGDADDCCTAIMEVPQKCDAEIAGLTQQRASCTTSSASPPPPNSGGTTDASTDDTAASLYDRYQYILEDMIHAMKSLTRLTDADFQGYTRETSTDSRIGRVIPNFQNFEYMRSIASENNIFFQLLMNDHSQPSTDKESKHYMDQTSSIGFALKGSDIKIITNNKDPIIYKTSPSYYSEGDDATLSDSKLVLGDLFGTYALAPQQVKKDLYCGKNTMTLPNGVQKIDPLLKMKSLSIMESDGYIQCSSSYFHPDCSTQGHDTSTPGKCDFAMSPDVASDSSAFAAAVGRTGSDYSTDDLVATKLREISLGPKGSGDDTDISNLISRYNDNRERILPRSASNKFGIRHQYEFIINDRSEDDLDRNKYTSHPSTQLIHINGSDVGETMYVGITSSSDNMLRSRINFNDNMATDEGGNKQHVDFDIPKDVNNDYTLLKAYGMSQNQNGDIYHSKYNTDNPSDDAVNNYFSNLLQIQYLITKIIIGTDRFLGEDLNIYDKNAIGPANVDPDAREPLNLPPRIIDYDVNTQCKESGRDWLLLVYKIKPTEDIPLCGDDASMITDNLGVYNDQDDRYQLCSIVPLPVSIYDYREKRCVNGKNIGLYTVENTNQCADLCTNNFNCKAFEYYHNHLGGDTGTAVNGRAYQQGDCQLNSSTDYSGCDGKNLNLDLYLQSRNYPIGYERFNKQCVNDNNISKHSNISKKKCAELCNDQFDCEAFEYYADYGGSEGNYRPGDCNLNRAGKYEDDRSGCPAEDLNLDIYVKQDTPVPNNYERFNEQCVHGNNISKHEQKTLNECANLCNGDSNCVAFEYYNNYKGTGKPGDGRAYEAGDCNLNSSSEITDCNGRDLNLDLYIQNPQ